MLQAMELPVRVFYKDIFHFRSSGIHANVPCEREKVKFLAKY